MLALRAAGSATPTSQKGRIPWVSKVERSAARRENSPHRSEPNSRRPPTLSQRTPFSPPPHFPPHSRSNSPSISPRPFPSRSSPFLAAPRHTPCCPALPRLPPRSPSLRFDLAPCPHPATPRHTDPSPRALDLQHRQGDNAAAAPLAQLAEQLTLNQRVEGSSPSGGICTGQDKGPPTLRNSPGHAPLSELRPRTPDQI